MRTDYPEPRLEPLYDMHVDLEAPQMVGQTPAGMRQVWVVKGGRAEGKVSGDLLPGGGDWALVRTDGAVQLDVRATLRTDDGAHIYAWYSGLIIFPDPSVSARIFSGEDVPLGEYYFYTAPMFSTGARQYAWLNQVVALGRGRVVPGGVEYRVWSVQNP